MFLGPEPSQETLKKPKSRPRSTQRPPKHEQKSTKKNQDKCLRGKKCLKPAISFSTILGAPFWWLFLLIFKFIVDLILDYCLNLFESHFGSHGGWKPAKERSKWLKTTIKGIKHPKSSILKKTFKKPWVFHDFWQQRPLKNVSRGPRCPQWFTHRNPNHKRKKPKIKAISFQMF